MSRACNLTPHLSDLQRHLLLARRTFTIVLWGKKTFVMAAARKRFTAGVRCIFVAALAMRHPRERSMRSLASSDTCHHRRLYGKVDCRASG